MSKKKTKLHMPTWLVITLFVLGVLFLLGGIVGHTDMVIIGCVLTTLSIIGSARDRKLPKWLSIALLLLGLVFLLGDTVGPIIGIVFIILGIIGFLGNRKLKVTQPKSASTIQHRPVQQLVTPKSSSSTSPKKSKSPLAIARDTVFLIIFAPIALIIVVVWFVVATDYRPESKNNNRSQTTTQQTAQDKAKQQAEDEAAAKEITKIFIDEYTPRYCNTHQHKNIPLPPPEGQPYGKGKDNLTLDECRTIITYLVDQVGTSSQKLESIVDSKVSVGMNRHELLMSWGSPSDIKSTHTALGESAQWVYGNPIYGANYVYLDNDIVTAVQN